METIRVVSLTVVSHMTTMLRMKDVNLMITGRMMVRDVALGPHWCEGTVS